MVVDLDTSQLSGAAEVFVPETGYLQTTKFLVQMFSEEAEGGKLFPLGEAVPVLIRAPETPEEAQQRLDPPRQLTPLGHH